MYLLNFSVWFGVIFVRAGFYEGGVFRFTLTLPEKFPDEEVPVSYLYYSVHCCKLILYLHKLVTT